MRANAASKREAASYSRKMDTRRFELVPDVAPRVTLHIEDDRQSLDPDGDLIELGIRTDDQGGFGVAVTLSLEEVIRFRDALTKVIETPVG